MMSMFKSEYILEANLDTQANNPFPTEHGINELDFDSSAIELFVEGHDSIGYDPITKIRTLAFRSNPRCRLEVNVAQQYEILTAMGTNAGRDRRAAPVSSPPRYSPAGDTTPPDEEYDYQSLHDECLTAITVICLAAAAADNAVAPSTLPLPLMNLSTPALLSVVQSRPAQPRLQVSPIISTLQSRHATTRMRAVAQTPLIGLPRTTRSFKA
jgi:hypothetical protein